MIIKLKTRPTMNVTEPILPKFLYPAGIIHNRRPTSDLQAACKRIVRRRSHFALLIWPNPSCVATAGGRTLNARRNSSPAQSVQRSSA